MFSIRDPQQLLAWSFCTNLIIWTILSLWSWSSRTGDVPIRLEIVCTSRKSTMIIYFQSEKTKICWPDPSAGCTNLIIWTIQNLWSWSSHIGDVPIRLEIVCTSRKSTMTIYFQSESTNIYWPDPFAQTWSYEPSWTSELIRSYRGCSHPSGNRLNK